MVKKNIEEWLPSVAILVVLMILMDDFVFYFMHGLKNGFSLDRVIFLSSMPLYLVVLTAFIRRRCAMRSLLDFRLYPAIALIGVFALLILTNNFVFNPLLNRLISINTRLVVGLFAFHVYLHRVFYLRSVLNSWILQRHAGLVVFVITIFVFALSTMYLNKDKDYEDNKLAWWKPEKIDAPMYFEGDFSTLWSETRDCEIQYVRWMESFWNYCGCQGEYVNTTWEGNRFTWNHDVEENLKHILMFGGSTMWGMGVRDEASIPSWVSKLLDKDDSVYVSNYGAMGLASTQELHYLEKLLREREQVPEIIVFMDGFNDTMSSAINGVAGYSCIEKALSAAVLQPHEAVRHYRHIALNYHKNKGVLRGWFRLVENLAGIEPLPYAYAVETTLAENTAYVYLENIRMIKALCKEYGITPLFYLQPIIWLKDAPSSGEVKILNHYAVLKDLFLTVYGRIKSSPEWIECQECHDLSMLFHFNEEPFYIDSCHVNGLGNRMLANIMVMDIKAALNE